MKCSNCPNDAIYVYEGSGVQDIPYCLKCLPSFMKPMVKAKMVRTTDAYRRAREDVLSRLAPETTEESKDEEVKAPAPRRRRTKAKTEESPAPIEEDKPSEEQAED